MLKFLNKKRNLKTLSDLQGKPYKFYRGESYAEIHKGRFFCSCFDIAECYRASDDMPIIEAEIATRNPLVIDATTEDGYSSYNYLQIYNCKLYPEEKRKNLISYMKRIRASNALSTDEVLMWAKRVNDIDAVIIKNVREGINSCFPIYDVMIWSEKNIVNSRNIVNLKCEFENFRKNTYKRVDLSMFISEKEQDGIASIKEGIGYSIEHIIKRNNTDWYLSEELIIGTNIPVKIYCYETCKYITAIQLDKGIYSNTGGVTSDIKLIPYNGIVRVRNILSICEYEIINYI